MSVQCGNPSEYFCASFTLDDLLLIHSGFKQYSTIHDIQSHLTQYIKSNNNKITLVKTNKTLSIAIKDFISRNDVTFHLHLSTLSEETVSLNNNNITIFKANNEYILSDSTLINIINTIHIVLLVSLSLLIYLKLTALFSSSIATFDDFEEISTWIDPSKQFKYRLLYKATRDGDSSMSFHGKCDNRGPTLTLIRTVEGWTFGGYTTSEWKSGVNRFERCEDVFIFSLTLHKKYQCSYEGNNIIVNLDFKGPTFGFGYDLSINDKCLSSESTCFSPSSFVGVNELNEFNGKKDRFVVKELEVYSVEVN